MAVPSVPEIITPSEGDVVSGVVQVECSEALLPMPLDDHEDDLEVAFGLRRLLTSYEGDAIRVRRSSDSTEQDIGFVAGALDIASLEAFCGAGDGFAAKWYDQSGNGHDAAEETGGLQPQVVAAGSVLTANGEPTVRFIRASATRLLIPHSMTAGSLFVFTNYDADSTFVDFDAVFSPTDASGDGLLGSDGDTELFAGGRFTDKFVNGASSVEFDPLATHKIVAAIDPTPAASASWVLGRYRDNASRPWGGDLSEAVLYATDVGATARGEIETILNDHFGAF